MKLRAFVGAFLSATLFACATPGSGKPAPFELNFDHGVTTDATPWTHEQFDAAEDKFNFAVFSDLTGGEREGVFAVAVEQLRLLRPEFIISVGDLIEGGTENRASLALEWDSFDDRSKRAVAPVFYVGGNHDLISPVQWDVWSQRYGPRYYHFTYRNTLFLVLDTEDNSPERQAEIHRARSAALERVMLEGWGIYADTAYAKMQETHTGTVSAAQSEYFREVIGAHPDVRWTFLFMHKPAWLKDGEQHFLTIEQALGDRPYTVFNGHNHDYLYRQRRGRDYIQLGTTGGVQLPGKHRAVDHIMLVTVSESGIDIANLEMAGIFDKTGRLPLNGEELCFEAAACGAEQ